MSEGSATINPQGSVAPIERRPFQTDQVVTIAGGHLVHDSYSAFLAPLLPLIQARLGIGYALVGSLAIFTQIPSLLNPFIGYLADRISVRYFVILAPGITATLYSSLGLAPNYLILAILLFAAGISIALFHAPAPAIIAKVSGMRVGTGMSIFMASGEFARTIGPIVAVAGVSWLTLEGIWRLAAIGWLTSFILYLRLRHVAATPRSHGSSDLSAFWPQARRVFLPLTWLSTGRVLMLAALTTFLPLYMQDERAASLWLAGISLTLLEGAGVVGALLAGTLSDKFGRKRVLLVLLGISPFLLLALTFVSSWLIIPLLLAVGLTAISPQPVMLALVQDQFPQHRALANGSYLAIAFTVRALGIWLVGLLADLYGLSSAFIIASLVALLSVPAVFFLPQQERSDHESP